MSFPFKILTTLCEFEKVLIQIHKACSITYIADASLSNQLSHDVYMIIASTVSMVRSNVIRSFEAADYNIRH